MNVVVIVVISIVCSSAAVILSAIALVLTRKVEKRARQVVDDFDCC